MAKPFQDVKTVDKPWGRELWYAHTQDYAGKVLEIAAGQRLSLQKHEIKAETLYLLRGRIRLTYDDGQYDWRPGVAVDIPPGTVHRMEAVTDSVVLEVSTPHLDDVVRLSDDYGRSG